MDALLDRLAALVPTVLAYLQDADVYLQLGVVFAALLLAWVVKRYLIARVAVFRQEPSPGVLADLRGTLYRMRELLFPVLSVVLLGAAIPLSGNVLGSAQLLRAAQGLALLYLVYSLADHFISSAGIVRLLKWIGVPIALLHMFGWLGEVTSYLDGLSLEVGNIQLTVYAIARTVVFGVVLFWLGRVSNATGQRVIRHQATLDPRTRELVAKLFEISLFLLIALLLLQVMGIDLTALAVFGGALGVGLGFGLQQIAANFISGVIILIDRSLAIGDYIELEDGRTGTLRELSMRSATLETYDGKDIMVPNERFITTAFTNWTHNNKKQRYSLRFQVAYKTDLEAMFDIVRATVASHPKVLSGDAVELAERPDAEIEGFGESGIDILVEFWMEGIDDGEHRVGGDLLLMIWTALKAHDIEIPFPQREVSVLRPKRS
jgi:small-conductance mechanosensitive channel